MEKNYFFNTIHTLLYYLPTSTRQKVHAFSARKKLPRAQQLCTQLWRQYSTTLFRGRDSNSAQVFATGLVPYSQRQRPVQGEPACYGLCTVFTVLWPCGSRYSYMMLAYMLTSQAIIISIIKYLYAVLRNQDSQSVPSDV